MRIAEKMLDYEQRKKDYEQRKKDDERENEKLDAMILQTKNDAKLIENENARLAVLESKIDGLFSKYNIKLPPGRDCKLVCVRGQKKI